MDAKDMDELTENLIESAGYALKPGLPGQRYVKGAHGDLALVQLTPTELVFRHWHDTSPSYTPKRFSLATVTPNELSSFLQGIEELAQARRR